MGVFIMNYCPPLVENCTLDASSLAFAVSQSIAEQGSKAEHVPGQSHGKPGAVGTISRWPWAGPWAWPGCSASSTKKDFGFP